MQNLKNGTQTQTINFPQSFFVALEEKTTENSINIATSKMYLNIMQYNYGYNRCKAIEILT